MAATCSRASTAISPSTSIGRCSSNCGPSRIPHGLPFAGGDNRDVGRLVADHFIDNGFANFAVFDLDTERYFEERRDNFRAHLASRGHTCDGINVADVVKQSGLARTPLERRMRQALGRTPGGEIVKVRFGRVQRLLADTNLSLAEIADRCGFEHPQYMAESFKKHFGITPGASQQARHGPAPDTT